MVACHIRTEVALADMLFPPGIRNSGSVCFATCILQCLFNQQLLQKFIHEVASLHKSSCSDCTKGQDIRVRVSIHYCYTQWIMIDSGKCIFSAVAELSKDYVYSPRRTTLHSEKLLSSLCCTHRCFFIIYFFAITFWCALPTYILQLSTQNSFLEASMMPTSFYLSFYKAGFVILLLSI